MNESGISIIARPAALPAFCGLGFRMDAVRSHAARLTLRARPAPAHTWQAPQAPDPVRPWGFDLMLTLNRQTRAG